MNINVHNNKFAVKVAPQIGFVHNQGLKDCYKIVYFASHWLIYFIELLAFKFRLTEIAHYEENKKRIENDQYDTMKILCLLYPHVSVGSSVRGMFMIMRYAKTGPTDTDLHQDNTLSVHFTCKFGSRPCATHTEQYEPIRCRVWRCGQVLCAGRRRSARATRGAVEAQCRVLTHDDVIGWWAGLFVMPA
uniref:Uncharacterized protein n=1 Tax=Romanomermis culicivorax TaxID=13658 RepID=A0A915IN82_ROMCU